MSSRAVFRRESPTASAMPISEARRSTPKRNSSATSITAAAIKNILSIKNSTPNGVVPDDASSACRLTGRNSKPSAAFCVSASRKKSSPSFSAVSPSRGAMRSEVSRPKRLFHSFWPAASETNALGVVR